METSQSTIDYVEFYNKQKKREPIIAVVLGLATLITLIFLVFAFIQKSEANLLKTKVVELQTELENARKQAELQMQQARANAEQQKMIAVEHEKLLLECLNKK
jgi:hypothetical protein